MSTMSAKVFTRLVDEVIEACYVGFWIEDVFLLELKQKQFIKFRQSSVHTGHLSLVSPKAKFEFKLNNLNNYDFSFILSSQTEMMKSVNLTWMSNPFNPKTSKEQRDKLKHEVGLLIRQFLIQSGIRFIPGKVN